MSVDNTVRRNDSPKMAHKNITDIQYLKAIGYPKNEYSLIISLIKCRQVVKNTEAINPS